MKKNYKRLWFIVTVCAMLFMYQQYNQIKTQGQTLTELTQELVMIQDKNYQLQDKIQTLNADLEAKYIEQERIKSYTHTQTVFMTNYYVDDSTGSGTGTSSGLTIHNFQTNELGWYTYKNKVVVAAATYVCLKATSGACAKYKTLPAGYSIFNLYDEITIIYNGKEYEGIVLDSCGSAFWKLPNEPHQRIDIFVAQTAKKFGKVVAQIRYYKEN